MANTAKKTAKTSTATKTAQRAVKIKTTAKERRTKKEQKSTFNYDQAWTSVGALFEKIDQNAKQGVFLWADMGKQLIEIRTNWIKDGGDLKTRATKDGPESWKEHLLSKSALTYQDSQDAIYIAENFSVVSKMNGDELKNGVNDCRKKIAAHIKGKAGGKQQGPANKNTTKKNAKKDDAAIDLSSLMTDPKAFGAMIGKLVNSKYDDTQKAAFVQAAGEHIIIAETK